MSSLGEAVEKLVLQEFEAKLAATTDTNSTAKNALWKELRKALDEAKRDLASTEFSIVAKDEAAGGLSEISVSRGNADLARIYINGTGRTMAVTTQMSTPGREQPYADVSGSVAAALDEGKPFRGWEVNGKVVSDRDFAEHILASVLTRAGEEFRLSTKGRS